MKRHRGGVRWGEGFFAARNVTFPFGALEIESDDLVLTVPGNEFRLKFSEISKVTMENRLFYKGLRFWHSAADVPQLIVFWTFSPAEVMKALDGFVVLES